jgi:hypothetical protein
LKRVAVEVPTLVGAPFFHFIAQKLIPLSTRSSTLKVLKANGRFWDFANPVSTAGNGVQTSYSLPERQISPLSHRFPLTLQTVLKRINHQVL